MIAVRTRPTDNDLTGRSKWWGEPDMPGDMEWPAAEVTDGNGERLDDLLTFVCQIRCEDLAPFDPEGLLPHEGMLWFFAALDYFLGDMDALSYPGMGEWDKKNFKVLWSRDTNDLHTHHVTYPDGTSYCRPAEAITLETTSPYSDGIRLLGEPYFDEVREEMPGLISLLQLDEQDCWGLMFHDCGMLNFLINGEDLRARSFEQVRCYLHSF